MSLDQLLERVDSKETFFEFIDALKKDKEDEDEKEKATSALLYSQGVNGWESGTIPAFLDAMHAFGRDNDDIKMDWKSFALLLYAGKFYE